MYLKNKLKKKVICVVIFHGGANSKARRHTEEIELWF